MARATKGLRNADKWKTATDAERMRIGERIDDLESGLSSDYLRSDLGCFTFYPFCLELV